MEKKLVNKVALITGASSGYGKATAKAFKDNGDTVVMASRNYENLELEFNNNFFSLFNTFNICSVLYT